MGGAAILKKVAKGRRGRRSIIDEDDTATFAVLSAIEPEQCYKRIICELGTGKFEKSNNSEILNLFVEESPVDSPKFDFQTAARVGQTTQNVEACELRYSCPLTEQQVEQLLA